MACIIATNVSPTDSSPIPDNQPLCRAAAPPPSEDPCIGGFSTSIRESSTQTDSEHGPIHSGHQLAHNSRGNSHFGSNEFLIEDVKTLGEDKFTREILAFYNMKKDITYSETEQQFKMDVLRAKLPNGKPAYYNRNILGKFFPPKEK